MTDKLLPCPFCGGEASVQTTYGYGVSEAFCLDCGAHTGYPPGGCTEAEAIAAWNTRATGSTLTAEQVRESWCGNLKRDCLYDPPTPDWQAIADEMNARAERTCEVEVRESAWGGYTRHCGNCGADLDCDTRNKQNYCPNCGRKVMP